MAGKHLSGNYGWQSWIQVMPLKLHIYQLMFDPEGAFSP
jgi:hypothetical protein